MKASSPVTTKRALITSLLVDLSDVVLNVAIALLTGSVVMVAESLQGLADFTAVALLMVGHKRSGKASTKLHPFGYGKELYFWTLLSGFIILAITATFSFYFGLQHFRHPHSIHNIALAYGVLVFSIITNTYALRLSAVRLLGKKHPKKMWRVFFESYDVAPKTTYILDLMGGLAAVFGLVALITYQLSGNERFDGLGAMLIGLTLGVFSVILLISIRDLVTGRSTSQAIENRIRQAALSHPAVLEVLELRTMIIGSDKILVNIDVHLRAGLSTNQIEQDMDEIKAAIHNKVPSAYHIQVEPETPDDELSR